jgi:hypothetical protein
MYIFKKRESNYAKLLCTGRKPATRIQINATHQNSRNRKKKKTETLGRVFRRVA